MFSKDQKKKGWHATSFLELFYSCRIDVYKICLAKSSFSIVIQQCSLRSIYVSTFNQFNLLKWAIWKHNLNLFIRSFLHHRTRPGSETIIHRWGLDLICIAPCGAKMKMLWGAQCRHQMLELSLICTSLLQPCTRVRRCHPTCSNEISSDIDNPI